MTRHPSNRNPGSPFCVRDDRLARFRASRICHMDLPGVPAYSLDAASDALRLSVSRAVVFPVQQVSTSFHP